jgi:hypothetical protein
VDRGETRERKLKSNEVGHTAKRRNRQLREARRADCECRKLHFNVEGDF